MNRGSLAGIGALAFGVLTIVGMIVINPPGGTYSAKDVDHYIRSGHRPLVFLGAYLGAFGIAGLVFLLARLRDAVADTGRAQLVWGLGIASAATIAAGYALVAAVPIAEGYGGKHVSIAPTVTFVFAESGWVIMTGGTILLGCALLAFALAKAVVPAWVRWSTVVAGVASLAGAAWFPLALLILWSVAIGVWLLARGEAPAATAVPA